MVSPSSDVTHAQDCNIITGVLDMFGNPAHPLPRDKPMVALEAVLLNAESDVNKRTIGFSEVMSGFIHSGPDIGDYEAATKLAKSRCEAARVFLDVKSWRIADRKCFLSIKTSRYIAAKESQC